MIIVHFHLKPQFIYELFHISFTSSELKLPVFSKMQNQIQFRLFPGVKVVLMFYKQNTNCFQTLAAHFAHIVLGGRREVDSSSRGRVPLMQELS